MRLQIADKDALDILRSHFAPIEHVKILSDAATDGTTTGSTGFVNMAGSSLSVAIPSGRAAYVFLIANMNVRNDTARNFVRAHIRCTTDAVNGPYSEGGAGDGGFEYKTLNPMWLRTGETGTKTYVIQWRVQAGGDTATATEPYLYAIVVSFPTF